MPATNEDFIEATNEDFIEAIKKSFREYLGIGGTSRSTAKLKPLHGFIASDLKEKFGAGYIIKSQGIGDDKEGEIAGRYYPKNVDITIYHNGRPVAGYAVKFVMRNYSQNNINYFENMLGETANIRANSIPYYQIFIIFDKVPYYEAGGKFKKYDKISAHNLGKYLVLSQDNPNVFFHTPDKTLITILKLKEKSYDYQYRNSDDYNEYYRSVLNDSDLLRFDTSVENNFGSSVLLNNYVDFITKTVQLTKGRE